MMDEKIKEEIRTRACPAIDGALPAWPFQLKEKAVWIGLHKNKFIYTHHSSHGNRVDEAKSIQSKEEENASSFEKRTEDLFCVPFPESQRLLSILRNSKGGSILVTGYRGTGKSSLVNYTISKLIEEKEKKDNHDGDNYDYVPIRINLSTSRTAMALVMMMIKELYHCSINKRFNGKEYEAVTKVYYKFIGTTISQEMSSKDYGTSLGGEAGTGKIASYLLKGKAHGEVRRDTSTKTGSTFQESPYTLHEAQQDLHRCLKDLNSYGYRVIFILDELDKLTPHNVNNPTLPYDEKLIEVQTIVSELKFLLTEANAFHIFIAGKDVDDSWQEDQNKGEGLFESIFVQNIYLPSTFTVRLKPVAGPHRWIKKFYTLWEEILDKSKRLGNINQSSLEQLLRKIFRKANIEICKKKFENYQEKLPGDWTEQIYKRLLNELGISHKNWTYNTSLLILPHFSENELFKLFLRSSGREKKDTIYEELVELLKKSHSKIKEEGVGVKFVCLFLQLLSQNDEYKEFQEFLENLIDLKFEDPISERRCRRIRYLLQYLTYKGRGIPRKILREFYALVQHRDVLRKDEKYWKEKDNIQHIVYEPTALRQKIKFFANIVSLIESHQDIFRYLDDKGCVATFHIIDYTLKFYQTGFNWSDIENASFMTQREELFPSRELVAAILEILEGHVITRIERRHKVYGLLPRIKHDLAGLYLAFGPEQIELRFTKADFSSELNQISDKIRKVETTPPEERLASLKTQLRIAKLYELLGNFQEARHECSKALRWARTDINRMMASEPHCQNTLKSTSIITYISIAVNILQKLGYLYELNSEFNAALHYYQSAVKLIESTWEFNVNEKSYILGERMNPSSIRRRWENSNAVPESRENFDKKLEELINTMVPECRDEINVFTRDLSNNQLSFTNKGSKGYPVYSAFEPIGSPNIINSLAVIIEKMWHRYASNRFMLLALDLYRSQFDEHKIIEQMIFIGEMLMRRRDIRLAASWYRLALERLEKYQKCFGPDYSSKQVGIRSTTRAKLFDYLGDIYYATNGTAFINSEHLKNKKQEDIEKEIQSEMANIKKDIELSKLDSREDKEDEEFFYTQASYYYGINNHALRVCDVYLKKLVTKFERLFKILKKRKNDSPGKEEGSIVDAPRCWHLFWLEAEKALNTLLAASPYIKKIQSLEKGRIIDQRRFGELFTIIGRMFMMISRRELMSWYWTEVQTGQDKGKDETYSNAEMEETVLRIDRIIGHLIDNKDFKKGMEPPKKNEKNICEEGNIGNRTPLWNLGSKNWRDICKTKQQNASDWLIHTNGFMVGQLHLLCDKLTQNINNYNIELKGAAKKETQKIKNKLRMLYCAELSLLSAHLALDDNLRDLESADASHRLGVLYLQCIEYLLKLRQHVQGNKNYFDSNFDDDIAHLYSSLHLAAKRFLVNAIDTYRAERRHARCIHSELGRTYRALGDLVLIRAEILEFSQKEENIDDRSTTFPGLEVPWGKLTDAINLQKKHIDDVDYKDVRHQVVESYRYACRQYLAEIENYIKRYRFPTDVYFLHKDIMDEKMHFDICQSIYIRHWDNITPDKGGKSAIKSLKKIASRLADELYNPYPRVTNRQAWLEDLYESYELVNQMSPNGQYIQIEKVEAGENSYKIDWVTDKKFKPGESATRNFFRSYDDGLGIRIDREQGQ
jgi:Cdc6-like AAA superfamily ATPase